MRAIFERMVWLFVFVLPVLCMGLLAQEWASGTIETMMTAPVSETDLVVGKFLGSFGFFLVLLVPTLFYVVFLIFISVIQFAAIFWFLSRGGVDTIFPDDIETRFGDVWGQDHVLERVKENVVLLENPEAIEARGGHVPGGFEPTAWCFLSTVGGAPSAGFAPDRRSG